MWESLHASSVPVCLLVFLYSCQAATNTHAQHVWATASLSENRYETNPAANVYQTVSLILTFTVKHSGRKIV